MEEKTYYDKVLDKLKNIKPLVYLFLAILLFKLGSELLESFVKGKESIESLSGSQKEEISPPLTNISGNDNNIIVGNNNTIVIEKENTSDEKLVEKSEKTRKAPIQESSKKVEISLQLNRKQQGFYEIFLDEKKIQPLATSTPLNPRLLIESNSQKFRQILITTRSGDTCQINSLFYDGMEKPVFRFVPDCKI